MFGFAAFQDRAKNTLTCQITFFKEDQYIAQKSQASSDSSVWHLPSSSPSGPQVQGQGHRVKVKDLSGRLG